MTHEDELLEKCVKTFKLMKRFAESDRIETNGKPMALREAIKFEADAAIKKLEQHLGYEIAGPGFGTD